MARRDPATVRAARIARSGAIISAVLALVGTIVVAAWYRNHGRTQSITGSYVNGPAVNGDITR